MSSSLDPLQPFDSAVIIQSSSKVLLNAYGAAFSWFLAFFVLSRFILEPLMPRFHPGVFTKLSIPDQRSYTVHHHWLIIKSCCIPGAWPYINIMFRGQGLTQPLFPGARISNADWLSVLYLAILSSFAWEICYRCKISPVSLLHHAGAIVLGAWQIAGDTAWIPYTTVIPADGQFIDQTENDLQFKIILTYGVFEIVFESWMHICCILHRRFAGQNRRTAKLWLVGGCWVLFGSLSELAIMGVLWSKAWSLWHLPMKIFMPILHFAFMAAQLHGARIGVTLYRKYTRKAIEEESARHPSTSSGSRDTQADAEAEARDVEKATRTLPTLAPVPLPSPIDTDMSKSAMTKEDSTDAGEMSPLTRVTSPIWNVENVEEEVSGR